MEPWDEVSDQVVEAILKVQPNEKQRWFLLGGSGPMTYVYVVNNHG